MEIEGGVEKKLSFVEWLCFSLHLYSPHNANILSSPVLMKKAYPPAVFTVLHLFPFIPSPGLLLESSFTAATTKTPQRCSRYGISSRAEHDERALTIQMRADMRWQTISTQFTRPNHSERPQTASVASALCLP